MCDYIGYEFGAGTYPDSICIEGYLFDADDCDERGRMYLHPDEEKIPCPKCNPEEHKKYIAEREEVRKDDVRYKFGKQKEEVRQRIRGQSPTSKARWLVP